MGVEFEYRVINSCAAGPFTGNPICVALSEPDEAFMQRIALQLNLAATVFPVRTGAQEYRMRLFTPDCEVPYAGSPSLAAAWAMGQGRWTQTTPGNVAEIEVVGDMAWLDQPEPTFEDIVDDDAIEGMGLRSFERLLLCHVASNRYVIAVTRDDPSDFAPKQDVLMAPATRYGGNALVGAVHKVDSGEVRARFFGPSYGIPEDPACGAVAGALAALMHREFATRETILIRQGEEMGRPSRISASVADGRIRMGGALFEMGRGTLLLPDTKA